MFSDQLFVKVMGNIRGRHSGLNPRVKLNAQGTAPYRREGGQLRTTRVAPPKQTDALERHLSRRI